MTGEGGSAHWSIAAPPAEEATALDRALFARPSILMIWVSEEYLKGEATPQDV
jgi:hypothetical protein